MHVFYNGFQTNERIATTLLDLHAECGRLEDTRKVFDRMVLEDAQLWNTMSSGFLAVGHIDWAKELFAMPERNTFTPGESIWGGVVNGEADAVMCTTI
ncbi:hypothetical protein ACP70R_016058 [Stipagrostis hirtigluma subsp. patula]